MNIADIYTIGCLLVWGVSLGIVVAMLCMGPVSYTHLTLPTTPYV